MFSSAVQTAHKAMQQTGLFSGWRLAMTGVALLSLAGIWPVQADDAIRRMALDGVTAVTAPAIETGKDGVDRIRQIESPALELFPVERKPSCGTVLICPGGGYGILAINFEGRLVAKKLNELGFDAAVLLYHVNAGKDTRELALADAQSALRLLQTRGTELGLNQKKIGVMGFSAGGHLVARLTHATASNSPPDFLVLMYPAYLEKNGQILDEVAPVRTPSFVYVAGDDIYAPSSAVYAAACQPAHVPCVFYLKKSGGHGFGLKPNRSDNVKDWLDKLKLFLDEQL